MMSEAELRRAWLIKLDPHTGMGLEEKIATKDKRATNNKMHAHFYIILPVIADFSDGNLLNGVYLIIQSSLANVRLWCIWKQILFIWKRKKHIFYLLTH
jgi:hypothetical protein